MSGLFLSFSRFACCHEGTVTVGERVGLYQVDVLLCPEEWKCFIFDREMSARRRGGKPNRGGGRFNKPRGGGGGGSRKGGAGGWDDGDDFSLDFGPARSSRYGLIRFFIPCLPFFPLLPDDVFLFRPGKGRGGGGGGGSRDGGRGRARDRDRKGERRDKALPRSLASARTWKKPSDCVRLESNSAPLQKIFMTDENQEQLKELLQDLQSQEYDEAYK